MLSQWPLEFEEKPERPKLPPITFNTEEAKIIHVHAEIGKLILKGVLEKQITQKMSSYLIFSLERKKRWVIPL